MPFRFREIGEKLIVTNEVGDHAFVEQGFVERFFENKQTSSDRNVVDELGLLISDEQKWKLYSLARRIQQRHKPKPRKIDYLIVVPTLRCNLSCSYCQVSRAPIDMPGYDWTEESLERFEGFVRGLDLDVLKVEFQGGEPTLRPDLILRTIEIIKECSNQSDFVICTNLLEIESEQIRAIIERPDVTLSTSIDGSLAAMSSNRTFDDDKSQKVFDNFELILNEFGSEKISALPTVTDTQIDDPRGLIDQYVSLGFQSVFLRPVNYMGFARKQHRESSQEFGKWEDFYLQCMDYILELNEKGYFEEYYAAILVRRIFAGEGTGFVDYRSPSRFINNFLVVDYDETIYPSDEARMLSRVHHVDLAMGSLSAGIDEQKLKNLNHSAENQTNPDCIHCAYQPYCGIDVIDDISRYDRFDIPKEDSWYCNRHLSLFDFIFSKVLEENSAWRAVFARWIGRSYNQEKYLGLFE